MMIFYRNDDEDEEEIRGASLFPYAYRAMVLNQNRTRTAAQYRKLVLDTTGDELDIDEAKEEYLLAKKIYRAVSKMFSDEDIEEISSMVE